MLDRSDVSYTSSLDPVMFFYSSFMAVPAMLATRMCGADTSRETATYGSSSRTRGGRLAMAASKSRLLDVYELCEENDVFLKSRSWEP